MWLRRFCSNGEPVTDEALVRQRSGGGRNHAQRAATRVAWIVSSAVFPDSAGVQAEALWLAAGEFLPAHTRHPLHATMSVGRLRASGDGGLKTARYASLPASEWTAISR